MCKSFLHHNFLRAQAGTRKKVMESVFNHDLQSFGDERAVTGGSLYDIFEILKCTIKKSITADNLGKVFPPCASQINDFEKNVVLSIDGWANLSVYSAKLIEYFNVKTATQLIHQHFKPLFFLSREEGSVSVGLSGGCLQLERMQHSAVPGREPGRTNFLFIRTHILPSITFSQLMKTASKVQVQTLAFLNQPCVLSKENFLTVMVWSLLRSVEHVILICPTFNNVFENLLVLQFFMDLCPKGLKFDLLFQLPAPVNINAKIPPELSPHLVVRRVAQWLSIKNPSKGVSINKSVVSHCCGVVSVQRAKGFKLPRAQLYDSKERKKDCDLWNLLIANERMQHRQSTHSQPPQQHLHSSHHHHLSSHLQQTAHPGSEQQQQQPPRSFSELSPQTTSSSRQPPQQHLHSSHHHHLSSPPPSRGRSRLLSQSDSKPSADGHIRRIGSSPTREVSSQSPPPMSRFCGAARQHRLQNNVTAEQSFHPNSKAPSVKLLQDVVKWFQNTDAVYQNMFCKKIALLVEAHRNSKRLQHCSHPVFETNLDDGKRILWTENGQDNSVLVSRFI